AGLHRHQHAAGFARHARRQDLRRHHGLRPQSQHVPGRRRGACGLATAGVDDGRAREGREVEVMLGRREFLHGWSVLALAVSLDAQVEIPSEFDTSLESIAVAFKASTGMTMGYLSQ